MSEIVPGPISRLPVELLRRIGEELPLDSLARFAATNKETNRAASYLLDKAKEVHRRVDRFIPRRDVDGSAFRGLCVDIAGLPKNHQIKPLLRLTRNMHSLPARALLGAIRNAVVLGARMLPEHKAQLGQVLEGKRHYLWNVEHMIGFQILAMHNAGLVPDRDDWMEPVVHWQLVRRPEPERLTDFEAALNETKPWLPNDRFVAARYLADSLTSLPEADRMPAFRLLANAIADLPPSHAVAVLDRLRDNIHHLPLADVPEALAVISSYVPRDESDRFNYAIALIRSAASLPPDSRLAVFSAVDVPEMQLPPEAKNAILKSMTKRVPLLARQDRFVGFQMIVEQCAGQPAAQRLDIVPDLLRELKRSRQIDPLVGLQLVRSLGCDMPAESRLALLKTLIFEVARFPAQTRLEAFEGIHADIRELPPAPLADALETLRMTVQHLPDSGRYTAFEEIRSRTQV